MSVRDGVTRDGGPGQLYDWQESYIAKAAHRMLKITGKAILAFAQSTIAGAWPAWVESWPPTARLFDTTNTGE